MSVRKLSLQILSVAFALSLTTPQSMASRNGAPVVPGRIPGLVLIASASGNGSGVLISPDLVLTVNHVGGSGPVFSVQAFVDYDPNSTPIQVGISDRKVFSVDQRSELTLLKLKKATSFKGHSLTAAVLGNSQALVGVGYGITDDARDAPDRKLRADMIFRGYTRVSRDLKKDGEPTKDPRPHDVMMELSPGAKNQLSCSGDSGGPIFLEVDGKYRVVGVSSHILNDQMPLDAYEFCRGAHLLRAVPVAAYREWIDQAAKELGARAPVWAN